METFKYNTVLVIILALYHAVFPPDLAASEANIDHALELYNNAEFEASRTILEKVLKTGASPQRQAAFLFLALIEQAHGNTEKSDKHIYNLYSLNPSFDLNPYEDFLFPELRQRFERIRSSIVILHISSKPSGALISLDGKNMGKTPKKICAPAKKKCTVTLHKAGFKKWRKTISPRAGMAEKISVELERTGASVAIASKPLNADIFLNGSKVGKTPKTIRQLKPGEYEIVIRKRGFEEWKTQVQLEESITRTVKPKLRDLSAEAGKYYASGLKYLLGQGVNKDYGEAVKWFSKSADAGNKDAQFSLGFCYTKGRGVPKDNTKAAMLFREAAEQGHVDAQYYLGVFYGKGEGVSKNTKEALKWIEKAANQGLREAQYSLGAHYDQGIGVDENDTEAANWYIKAANQGHAKAQRDLGILYRIGKGVKQDPGEAVRWFMKAGEKGDILAQHYMGIHYGEGLGISQDHKQSRIWFIKAAEQGDANSQYNLGVIYENGIGTNKDMIKALKWYLKAAENGNEEAGKALERIE